MGRFSDRINLLLALMVVGMGLMFGGELANNGIMLFYAGTAVYAVSFISVVLLFVYSLITHHRVD